MIFDESAGARTVVHVCSETWPGAEYAAVEPDLEDVCFSTMAGSTCRRAERPEPEVARS